MECGPPRAVRALPMGVTPVCWCSGMEPGSGWEEAVSLATKLTDQLTTLVEPATADGGPPRANAASGWVAPPGSVVVELMAVAQRVQALLAAAVAGFGRSSEWGEDGARSAAGWLAAECRLPHREVARWGTLGGLVERLPVVARAWAAGTVATAHVAALASVCNHRTSDAMVRDQDLLVECARTLSYGDFRRALAYWLQHADPDGCEAAELDRQQRRRVSLHQSFEGTWFGDLRLDPVSGAIVANELQRLDQQLFDADVADAAERRRRDPDGDDTLRRTATQRRADALVEMAIRSRGGRSAVSAGLGGRSSADGGDGDTAGNGRDGDDDIADHGPGGGLAPPGPLFTVLVDWPTLAGRTCELANGHPVTPGALVPWLGAADLERAVWRGRTRVDVAATSRLFTGATRRAIEVRDRRCTHPYCSLPAERCQVDHIVAHTDGGPTTQANGQLLCAFHNRRKELLRRRVRTRPDLSEADAGRPRPPPDPFDAAA